MSSRSSRSSRGSRGSRVVGVVGVVGVVAVVGVVGVHDGESRWHNSENGLVRSHDKPIHGSCASTFRVV